MDLATISANGQITLPVDVRTRLHLVPGDKVVFVENEQGDTVLVRPSVSALLQAQREFRGAAKQANLESEEDLNRLVAEVRSKRKQRMA